MEGYQPNFESLSNNPQMDYNHQHFGIQQYDQFYQYPAPQFPAPQFIQDPAAQQFMAPQFVQDPAAQQFTAPQFVQDPAAQQFTAPQFVQDPAAQQFTAPQFVQDPPAQQFTAPQFVQDPAQQFTAPQFIQDPAAQQFTAPQFVQDPAAQQFTAPQFNQDPAQQFTVPQIEQDPTQQPSQVTLMPEITPEELDALLGMNVAATPSITVEIDEEKAKKSTKTVTDKVLKKCKCPKCKQPFTNRSKMNAHLKKEHLFAITSKANKELKTGLGDVADLLEGWNKMERKELQREGMNKTDIQEKINLKFQLMEAECRVIIAKRYKKQ